MAKPETWWRPVAADEPSDAEVESRVALLADEAEYWKARAEALDHIIGELSAEIEAVQQRADIAEAWRKGLAEDLLDGAGFSDSESPFRGMALILCASVTIWVLLGLLAFGAYSFLAG
jgi:hypothetical protein